MHQLAPALPRFSKRYPEVQVDLLIEDRDIDLVKEDIDISVRPGPTAETAYVVRKICEFERAICAAPDYLERQGVPHVPEDLAKHHCIVLSGFSSRAQWSFAIPCGRQVMDIVPRTIVNNADCALRFALMGFGIVRLNEFVVAEALQQGRLVRVLERYQLEERAPMLALYPRTRHRLPRVAAMLEFLVTSFAHAPWRIAS
jgi:DNA-binding transcriptional LysR family regulator